VIAIFIVEYVPPSPDPPKKLIRAGTAFSFILASLRGAGPPHPGGEAKRPAETVRMYSHATLMVDSASTKPLKEGPQKVIILQMEKCDVCDKPVDQCTCCPE
jgi:hypothetical protein